MHKKVVCLKIYVSVLKRLFLRKKTFQMYFVNYFKNLILFGLNRNVMIVIEKIQVYIHMYVMILFFNEKVFLNTILFV